MIKNIFLAFIPIFVAVDAIGVIPLFLFFTMNITKKEKQKIILQSMLTATVLAVGFIFLGKGIFNFLGIEMGDFMLAGGAVLFCIAILDIISPEKTRRAPSKDFGAVPLGTPLIAGPAVLTTSLIIIGEYGLFASLISIIVNILLAGLIFSFSHFLIKVLGETGAKAMSKVTSLFLAAIAVMLMRKGIVQLLTHIR